MRPWMANLLGLAIGFALGAAALVRFLPQLEAARQPASPTPPAASDPAGARPARMRPAAPAARDAAPPVRAALRAPPPVPLPRIVTPDLPRWSGRSAPRLPTVVQPDPPRRTVGTAGTGFFVAKDGTLLTAAHVVARCRRMQVVSRLVPRTRARVLAVDHKDDLALLRSRVRVPAVLPIGRPARAAGRVFILGYPASAGLKVPAETWGALENARLRPAIGDYADPRFLVWLHASAITHGYSGGPILDPRDGEVVGLVKATLDGQGLRRLPGIPTTGLAIGPGSSRLIGFLQRRAPWLDVTQASAEDTAALDLARRATVHVFCWH